jgi:hypothetical protein
MIAGRVATGRRGRPAQWHLRRLSGHADDTMKPAYNDSTIKAFAL